MSGQNEHNKEGYLFIEAASIKYTLARYLRCGGPKLEFLFNEKYQQLVLELHLKQTGDFKKAFQNVFLCSYLKWNYLLMCI